MIHIYHGSGKGKTTTALGLAIRMAGHHKKCLIAQFLKDGTSGEIIFLKNQSHIIIHLKSFTFKWMKQKRQSV